MQIEDAVTIAAPAQPIWAALTDVERWHEWTASITGISRLDVGPFGAGSRVRIRQPRLPEAVWEVTDFEPGKGFVWESRSAGIHSKAEHWIEETGGGECQVTLVLNQTGFLSALLSPFVSGLVRRYVHMEAVGLKKRSEEQWRTSRP